MSLNDEAALVVWLRMLETSGTDASDSSPGGTFDGTLAGGPPTFVATGRPAGGVDFVAASLGRIAIADNDALSPAAISVSLWFKADIWSVNFTTICDKTNPGTPFAGWCIRRSTSNLLEVRLFAGASGTVTTSFNDTTNWNHTGFTYDNATDSTLHLYLNGVEVGTPATAPNAACANTTTALWIGGDANNGRHFDGQVSDFRLYSRQLSAAEMLSLYSYGRQVLKKRMLGAA